MNIKIKYLFLCIAFLQSTFTYAETFNSDGVEIYYTDEGAGEPIILIHGYTVDANANFRSVGLMNGLSSEFRVISLDNRGHGKSGKPHSPKDYGVQMVRDVINLMDHLGLEKANIVGYSMGGMITNKLVSMYPDRIIKAVSGGAGWSEEPDMKFFNNLAESLEKGNGLAPLIELITPIGVEPPSKEVIDTLNKQLLANNDPLALAAVARGFKELANIPKEKMMSNTVPILYIVGNRDSLKDGVENTRGVVKNSRIKVIPGEDHGSTPGNPEFLESIKTFFRAN